MADRDLTFFLPRSVKAVLVWIVIAIVLTCIPKTRKMWSDYDDRNGYYLSGGKFVLENVIARPPAPAVDNSVILKIRFPNILFLRDTAPMDSPVQ